MRPTRQPYEVLSFYLVACATFLLDQFSKLAIVTALALGHSRPLIDGLVQLTYAQNTGAAFSLLWGHAALLAGVALAIALAILVYERRAKERGPALVIGLGFLLGGALGNFADRATLGYVRDMVDLQWHGANIFPIFNVADMAVFTGVACLLVHQALTPPRQLATVDVEGDPLKIVH